jgi:hypothetical protein
LRAGVLALAATVEIETFAGHLSNELAGMVFGV